MTNLRLELRLALPLCAAAGLLLSACGADTPVDSVPGAERLAAADELARHDDDRGARGERAREAYLRLARWYREIYTPPIDFNGDGYADMASGLHGFDEEVVVYLGGPSGFPSAPSQTVASPEPESYLAFWRAAAVGDVNADGYDDLLVGANFAAGTGGAAYLFLGNSSGVSATPDAVIRASDTGLSDVRSFGLNIAPARDVDLDGYDDVLISAPSSSVSDDYDGAVFLYRGGPSGLETTPTATFTGTGEYLSSFGQSMTATYINGDRYPDLVIGESRNQLYGADSIGHIHVFLGGRGGFSTTPDQVLDSPDADYSGFGMVVSRVGDINLDGYGDVVVTEPFVDGADGRAFVYLGTRSGLHPVPGLQLDAPASGRVGYFGWDAGGGGDVDRNGLADLVVGETDANGLEGEAHAWFGPFFVRPGDSANPRVMTPDATVAGTETGKTIFFGQQVSLLGDVDGDGSDDFLVGAPRGGEDYVGRLYRFEGSGQYSLSSTPEQVLEGPDWFTQLGMDLSR